MSTCSAAGCSICKCANNAVAIQFIRVLIKMSFNLITMRKPFHVERKANRNIKIYLIRIHLHNVKTYKTLSFRALCAHLIFTLKYPQYS